MVSSLVVRLCSPLAGSSDSWNSEKLLVHDAAGKIEIAPGTLFVIDEGSMMSMEHLAWLTDLAYHTGGKILLCNDHAQLAAVESGCGMMLAARGLGYTQLAVPVWLVEQWERDVSLRLRLGDQTASRGATMVTMTGGRSRPRFPFRR